MTCVIKKVGQNIGNWEDKISDNFDYFGTPPKIIVLIFGHTLIEYLHDLISTFY